MNVIVANEQLNQLANLDVDIIKSISGKYDTQELVEMFKNFFFSKMILDVTALNDYQEVSTYESLVQGLDPDKIIFLLPEGSALCTPNFLGHLISIGIYNFTTNLNGIKYLLRNPNTLDDVEHIRMMANAKAKKSVHAENVTAVNAKVHEGTTIIGVRNVTEGAGATTFIYMLKKEIAMNYGSNNVIAIEIDKSDFHLFNDKNMLSVKQSDVRSTIKNHSNVSIILVDLNQCNDDSFCGEVLYLVEPSTLKLNKLIRREKNIFSKLMNCKVILNKSMLLTNDVFDFEGEAGVKVFYNMPPLDERKRNSVVNDFLTKLGLFNEPKTTNNSSRIFGLFRR